MSSDRKQRYKNAALDSQELRRRREEEGVQLRKAKRDEQIFKKRNVGDDDGTLVVSNPNSLPKMSGLV